MNMCALLGRNSRFAAQHTIPTSTTMSPGNTPQSRLVWGILGVFSIFAHFNHNFISDCGSIFCLQKAMVEEKVRSSGENRLDIQSILTISSVDLTDTGNISCIGTNEAGVNSSTTYLLVVGKLQKHFCYVTYWTAWNIYLPLKTNSFKQTSRTSGYCPSSPLNWPTRVFRSRWTREKIWSSAFSSKRTPKSQSTDGTPQHLLRPHRSTSSSDTTTGTTQRPKLVTKEKIPYIKMVLSYCTKVSAEFKRTIKCTTGRGSHSVWNMLSVHFRWIWHRAARSYLALGHEAAAKGKSGVLFLICWRVWCRYIGSVWIQTTELVTLDPADIPLFLSLNILFVCVCVFF